MMCTLFAFLGLAYAQVGQCYYLGSETIFKITEVGKYSYYGVKVYRLVPDGPASIAFKDLCTIEPIDCWGLK